VVTARVASDAHATGRIARSGTASRRDATSCRAGRADRPDKRSSSQASPRESQPIWNAIYNCRPDERTNRAARSAAWRKRIKQDVGGRKKQRGALGGVFSYLSTSRRDTCEIRPCHSLSRAQHRTAPIHRALLEQHLPPTVGRSLSCSISLVPSTFLPFLSWSTCPFLSLFLFLSRSICPLLSLSLSLSPPPPRSRRQEISFVVDHPFLTAPSPCSRGRRSGRVNERDAAIGDDGGDDNDGDVADGEGDARRD